MIEIYKIDDLKKIEEFLESQMDKNKLRETLYTEFLKYADYKNVTEWNKAVKLCESLAIIGWGDYEPLEALKGIYFNGNPMTFFCNKFGECRFVDAIWSKRKTGFTMEQGRTTYHFSPDQKDEKQTILWEYETKEDIQDLKIESQRNWVPKNPIWIERGISNCYENSKAVIESVVNDLQPALNLKMQPEKYGNAVNRIVIKHAYSYFDHAHCKTNYVILESDKKISNQNAWEELHKIYPKEEITENGYYLRNRFEYGPFRADTGKVQATIHFEKSFSELNHKEQKEKLSEYTLTALNTIIDKLKKKKLHYDFDLMLEDFIKILNEWKMKN
ncbi:MULTISPECIES: hypothetical protein [Acinetobacter]|uniref:Uncharacterized protein n=1 Tax=Acinetobacter higginsii TaxID=70347 RepID=N9SV89_9GAMM|nr:MULTISPECIES: hypothetical protein [Acinetobacter]ENX58611.1 hypothetical protein F902_03012 [Acinetobacter higginsii]MCH7305907.1 hypothetical protein [Acinetobacter higginsii]